MKKCIFFKKRNFWLIIPAILVFSIAFITFIVATFFDYQISEVLSKFFDNPFGNFLAYWSSNTGNFALYVALVAAFSVLLETWWIKNKFSRKDNWLKRNEWLIWLIYGLFLATYIGVSIVQLVKIPTLNLGMGVGVKVSFLDTFHKFLIYRIVFFGLGLFIFSSIVYFMRFYFSKNSSYVFKDYWVDALKIIFFSAFIYLIVIILKISFGRPFYFNNVFATEMLPRLEKVPGFHRESWSTWQQLDYYPWYSPFAYSDHLKAIFTFKADANLYNNAFPSGHMASCLILFSMIWFGIGHQKNRYSKWMVVFSYLMWIQVIALTFGMVIYRFHWMTDMTFTLAIGIVCFYLVDLLFTKKFKLAILNQQDKFFQAIR